MRNIRKLYLQNRAGERWDLNGSQDVYASGLSGFGFSLSPEFTDLTAGFFSPVSNSSEPQSPVPFTMTFTKNPYETYQLFVDWICRAGALTLVYSPVGPREYYKDVTVGFIQKGELNSVGWLEVPCSFTSCGPWHLPAPTTLSIDNSGLDLTKRYSYQYTDSLMYGEDNTASISTTVAGAGHVPGALELTYYGAITNPRIRLVGNISGRVYGICALSVILEDTDQLIYASRYEESFVKKRSSDGKETDLLDCLDLQLTPFFRVPIEEPTTLTVEADASFSGVADLMVHYYYRSV